MPVERRGVRQIVELEPGDHLAVKEPKPADDVGLYRRVFSVPRERRVIVEGHTDSVPIRTAQFASNWEVSSARACEVIRFFMLGGLDPSRMQAVGFADTKPVEENVPKVGSAKNRRVVLVVS